MQIKITGKNKELFESTLTSVLNISAVVAMGGYIPEDHDIENAQQSGRYWARETEGGVNRFNLYPRSNSYFANIRDKGDNYIVLEFSYRYDRAAGGLTDALQHLIVARFRDDVTILENG